jgi:anaphase-promoting complex subunit 6
VRGHGLAASADVVAARAAHLYAAGDARGAAAAARGLLTRDPAATGAIAPYVAACVDLGRKADLFALAHALVDADPRSGDAWHAVGCYYLAANAPAAARAHFTRAVRLAPRHAPAWAGLGAAASALDESDQAVAAYRSAARHFPGAAAPLVGMAVEAARMGHAGLADALLAQAHERAPDDPLPCHEAGVAALARGDAAGAEAWLRRALDRVPAPVPAPWEPTLVALGHALRKQGRLADAASAYEAALALAPREPGTHAALGLTRHLAGDPAGAAAAYHVSLGLRPGDALTADLLAAALADDVGAGGDGGVPDVPLAAALAAAARGGEPALVGG